MIRLQSLFEAEIPTQEDLMIFKYYGISQWFTNEGNKMGIEHHT